MVENKEIQTVDTRTEVLDVDGTNAKLASMMAFVKQNLKKDKDFMSIQGDKPTLLKSGAEKMNILMGYCPHYEKTKEVMNPDDKFYYVEIKCSLKNKQGNIVAECLGSCNNQERNRKNIAFADALNTVLKIAEKRAYVGATLNANALSQFYTQDLEDCAEEHTGVNTAKQVFTCSVCAGPVTENVAKYSREKRGKVLCMECQKKQI
jgi:hypothetical protein